MDVGDIVLFHWNKTKSYYAVVSAEGDDPVTLDVYTPKGIDTWSCGYKAPADKLTLIEEALNEPR